MAKRNYIKEAHDLGMPYRDLAGRLGISPSTARNYAKGKTHPPKSLYESTRNARRTANYQYLRQAGIPDHIARASRRMSIEASINRRLHFEDITSYLANKRYDQQEAAYRRLSFKVKGGTASEHEKKQYHEFKHHSRDRLREKIIESMKRSDKSVEDIEES